MHVDLKEEFWEVLSAGKVIATQCWRQRNITLCKCRQSIYPCSCFLRVQWLLPKKQASTKHYIVVVVIEKGSQFFLSVQACVSFKDLVPDITWLPIFYSSSKTNYTYMYHSSKAANNFGTHSNGRLYTVFVTFILEHVIRYDAKHQWALFTNKWIDWRM